jgi:hydrogenase maturation protease
MDRAASERVLVLGIGNLLWADEGFGIRAAETLAARYALPESVEVVDGGTQGLYLLPHVQSARRLIVFDAVDYRLAPGTLKVVVDDEVPACLGVNKVSLHQSSFQEVLALAALTGRQPEHVVLIGVQPLELRDFGGSLSEVVKARVPDAVAIAVDVLAKWGVTLVERGAGPTDGCETREPGARTTGRLNARSLAIDAYEGERPAPTEAFRGGDARFLNTLDAASLARSTALDAPSLVLGGAGERDGRVGSDTAGAGGRGAA